jgi:hypothetical protein
MLYTGGPPTNASLNTLATGISAAFSTNLSPLMSTTLALVGINIEDLTSGSAAQGNWSGSVAGTRAGVQATINDATLLNFTIARRYRGGKPRLYLPFGVNADQATDASWSAALQTAVNNGWTSFITAVIAVAGAGCTLTNQVNVSAYSGFASVQNPVTKRWKNIPMPRAGNATIDVVLSHSMNLVIGSQRRRLRALTP